MDPVVFDDAAEIFLRWVRELSDRAPIYVRQAKNSFDGHVFEDASPEQSAELILRQVYKSIIDVMASYDDMLSTLRMSQEFDTYFGLQDLTQDQLRHVSSVIRGFLTERGEENR